MREKTRNKVLVCSKLDFGKISSWELDHEFLDGTGQTLFQKWFSKIINKTKALPAYQILG